MERRTVGLDVFSQASSGRAFASSSSPMTRRMASTSRFVRFASISVVVSTTTTRASRDVAFSDRPLGFASASTIVIPFVNEIDGRGIDGVVGMTDDLGFLRLVTTVALTMILGPASNDVEAIGFASMDGHASAPSMIETMRFHSRHGKRRGIASQIQISTQSQAAHARLVNLPAATSPGPFVRRQYLVLNAPPSRNVATHAIVDRLPAACLARASRRLDRRQRRAVPAAARIGFANAMVAMVEGVPVRGLGQRAHGGLAAAGDGAEYAGVGQGAYGAVAAAMGVVAWNRDLADALAEEGADSWHFESNLEMLGGWSPLISERIVIVVVSSTLAFAQDGVDIVAA